MNRFPGVRRFFRLPVNEGTVQSDVDAEVGFHLESRVAALVRAGSTPEQALEQALREFGDVSAARGELAAIDRARVRRSRRLAVVSNVWHDAKLAARGMVREPGFSLAVVLTLGLGLGLNAAMFGITDRLLFRPPAHVQQADQVKRLYFTRTRGPAGLDRGRASAYPEYRALAEGARAFVSVAAYFNTEASLGRGQEAQRVRWTMATASFFPTLGVRPFLGRFYTEAEDAPGKAEAVIVLSYEFWRRHFGGEVSVLGRTIEVDGLRYAVIGVAPRGFSGVELEPVDLFAPMSVAAPRFFDDSWTTTNTSNWSWLRIIARLRPGVLPEQVSAEADGIMQAIHSDWANDRNAGVTAESIILARAPGDWGNSLPDTGRIAFWLSGVSMMVMLIASANVTNLMLARLARRQREIAIRLALGVMRARLIGYFVIEALLLAVTGAFLGLGLAHVGGTMARRLLLGDLDWSVGTLDARVLGFMLILVVVCGLITAVAPAFHSLSTHMVSTLKSGARTTGSGGRTRSVIVVLQTTLSVLMLVGSGLFVKSLLHLNSMPRGFDASRVVMLSWTSSLLDLDGGVQGDQLYRAAALRVRALPAVENSAVAMTAPFWSSIAGDARFEGVDSIPRIRDGGPYYNGVTHEYFATMGTRIVRGRAFTENDGKPGQPAAIVSATMARLLWPNQNPLGKCVYAGRTEPRPCSRVVGVAEDAMRDALEGDVMQYYLPLDQVGPSFRTLFVRTRGEPATAVAQIRAAVQNIRPGLPAPRLYFVAERMQPLTRPWRLGATLFTAFGGLAVLLAAIGLYSVIAYNVTQRRQEIGLRLALGARNHHLLRLVLNDAGRLVAAGVVLGLAGALVLAPRASPLLFQTSPRDPLVLAGVAGMMALVGLVAVLVPARRVLRLDPVRALKLD